MRVPVQYRVYLALGSNVGDRMEHLRAALRALSSLPVSRVTRTSRVYETRPVGPSDAPYLNAVVEYETVAAPLPLLDVCLQIERARGRRRETEARWGARTLDLDLLVVQVDGMQVKLRRSRLELPHPRMRARDFVLRPLAELAPDLVIDDAPVFQWLAKLPPSELTVTGRHPERLLPTPPSDAH